MRAFILRTIVKIFFCPAFLRYNYHIKLNKFQVYNVMFWYTCMLWNDYHNKDSWHISHFMYSPFFVFSKFQVYNTMLLTVVTMPYIRPSEPVPSAMESLYTLINISPSALTPSLWQPSFYSHFHEFDFFRFHICEIIHFLSLSVWLISLSTMPSKSIHVIANGRVSFFFTSE